MELPEEPVELLFRFACSLDGRGRLLGVLGPLPAPDLVRELIVDPLAGLDRVPELGSLADVGSGGGAPGIPLAIVRPDLRVVLVESNRRKCGFLAEVVADLGLGGRVAVVAERAEDLGRKPGFRASFDVVTAKAVAPMPVLLELCLPLLRVGGRLVAWKGPRLDEELGSSGGALRELRGDIASVAPYQLGGRSYRLCVVEKRGATPERYPRRAGTPERQPL